MEKAVSLSIRRLGVSVVRCKAGTTLAVRRIGWASLYHKEKAPERTPEPQKKR